MRPSDAICDRVRSDRVGRDTESRMVVCALVSMRWSPGHETRPRLGPPVENVEYRRNVAMVAFATKRRNLRPRSDRVGRHTDVRHLRTAKRARGEHRRPAINAPAPRSTAARSYRIASSCAGAWEAPAARFGASHTATGPPPSSFVSYTKASTVESSLL